MIESELTICINCKFYIGKRTEDEIWYNQFCKADSRELAINPVNGKACYKGINSLGEVYYTDEPFSHCRDINIDGHCLSYEPVTGGVVIPLKDK